MSDQATGVRLLRAVLAAPDDDDLRLVYADWLEDDGRQLRARLIRAQVALASRPGLSRLATAEVNALVYEEKCSLPPAGFTASESRLHNYPPAGRCRARTDGPSGGVVSLTRLLCQ